MTILKPIRYTTLKTLYEQYFIHTLYQKGQLIPEQSRGEKNPLVQLAIDHTHIPLREASETASFIPYT
jgi:hypothetical protein